MLPDSKGLVPTTTIIAFPKAGTVLDSAHVSPPSQWQVNETSTMCATVVERWKHQRVSSLPRAYCWVDAEQ